MRELNAGLLLPYFLVHRHIKCVPYFLSNFFVFYLIIFNMSY